MSSQRKPFIRTYLRASTDDQDATRAKSTLENFLSERDEIAASTYIENASGNTINRPELIRMINEAVEGDIILLEQVDRLTRLKKADWEKLKELMKAKKIKVVALDLPLSYQFLEEKNYKDEFQKSMMEAMNDMMMDMLAAIAHKDYEDRRRRQRQGIDSLQDKIKDNKTTKRFGKRANSELHEKIETLLIAELSWPEIIKQTGASRSTVARVSAKMKAA